jgi:FAD:protein FMN transferase
VLVPLLAEQTTPVVRGEEGPQKQEFLQIRMGVPVNIQVYAADPALANQAVEAAYERMRELDRILSDYDPDSELMQLVHTAVPGKDIPVSGELLRVLQESQTVSERSDGAFDVTVGPIVRLWRRARRRRAMPDPQDLAAALTSVGYRNLRIDADESTVALLLPEMRIDLGGIAKGYAADEALRVLREHGLSQALVDAGGDIVAGDPPPGRNGWRIAIEALHSGDSAENLIELSNASVATSGDAYQFVEIDGVRYSHIVDPKTGLGLTTRSSVTVIAPTGMQADSLASAVSVLGPERGIELIENTSDTEAFVVTADESGSTHTFQSSGFGTFVVPRD